MSTEKYQVQTTDKVVQENIKEFDLRSVVGVSKYDITLDKNLTDDFYQHLLEELLDAANYVRRLMMLEENRPDNFKSYHGDRIGQLIAGEKSDQEKLRLILKYFNQHDE